MDTNTQTVVNPVVVTNTSASSNDNLLKFVLIWIIWFIGPLVMMSDADQLVQKHAKQALAFDLVALAVCIVLGILSNIPFIGLVIACLFPLAGLGFFLVAILSIMKGKDGQILEMPIVDDVAKMLWKK